MHESDLGSFCTDSRRFIEHTDAVLVEVCDRLLDIMGLETEVMESFAAFVEEFGDRGILRSGFEQFDPNIADLNKGDAHFFGGNFFDLGDR